MGAKTLFEGGVTGNLWLDRRKFYLSPNETAEKFPDVTPFTTFLMNLPQKTTDDRLYKMFEHRSAFIKQEMVTSTTDTVPNSDVGVTLAISSLTNLGTIGDQIIGLECEVWDTTRSTLKGVGFVAARSGSNITFKSLKADTISVAATDILVVVGNVRGEGSTAPEAWADDLVTRWNSTQFYSVPVNITGDLYLASTRGYSNELMRLRDEKFKEYKMQKEQSFLKGVSVIGTNMDDSGTFAETNNRTLDSDNISSTYGFISAIEDYGNSTKGNELQNIFNITSATYKYADYVDDMEQLFDFKSSDQAFAFAGKKAMSYWSKLDGSEGLAGKSGWHVNIADMGANKMGFNVRELQTPSGVLHLTPTKALRYQYENYMAIPDHNHISQVVQEQDTFKHDIKKEDDYDGIKDVYRGKAGIAMDLIENHSIIKID